MDLMPVPSRRLKNQVEGELDHHASRRWPRLEEVTIRWHGSFGYLTGHLPGDEDLPLCRIRYLGAAEDWQFALNHASTEDYQDTLLPSSQPTGTPKKPSTAPAAST
jgi:hypothetical protein